MFGDLEVFTPLRLRTVSFHNFKSQNFKLSVSKPKNKYVAYLSVLSQITNCLSLGRKNKHEILKTDRTCRALGGRCRLLRVLIIRSIFKLRISKFGVWVKRFLT